jgi:excisionase family DNA binding protein
MAPTVRSTGDVDRERLEIVLGTAAPRYLAVAEAARASGFSRRAVYRAIDRGELTASVVCSRLRIHPDDFLTWMEGQPVAPREPSSRIVGIGARSAPATNGLRGMLAERKPAA